MADFSYFNTPLDPTLIAGLAQPTPPPSRVFTITSGASATISGLTIAGGQAQQGGGIFNGGTLALNGDELTQNTAQGAIIAGNAAAGLGGAIFNTKGAYLTVDNTTFAFNTAVGASVASGPGGFGRGGAIYNALGAVLVASDDTFAGNNADAGSGTTAGTALGGAIDNAGTAALVGVTIAGGLLVNGTGTPRPSPPTASASTTWPDSTDARQLDRRPPGADPPASLVGTDVANSGTATGSANFIMNNHGLAAALVASSADPNLGPFGNNGGTTPTYAPHAGSLAIDAGSNAALSTAPAALPRLGDRLDGQRHRGRQHRRPERRTRRRHVVRPGHQRTGLQLQRDGLCRSAHRRRHHRHRRVHRLGLDQDLLRRRHHQPPRCRQLQRRVPALGPGGQGRLDHVRRQPVRLQFQLEPLGQR